MGNPCGASTTLYPVGCRTEKAELIPGSKNARAKARIYCRILIIESLRLGQVTLYLAPLNYLFAASLSSLNQAVEVEVRLVLHTLILGKNIQNEE